MPLHDSLAEREPEDDLPARVRAAVRVETFAHYGKSCSTCDDGREPCVCGAWPAS